MSGVVHLSIRLLLSGLRLGVRSPAVYVMMRMVRIESRDYKSTPGWLRSRTCQFFKRVIKHLHIYREPVIVAFT